LRKALTLRGKLVKRNELNKVGSRVELLVRETKEGINTIVGSARGEGT
jgi:hypothetical protein